MMTPVCYHCNFIYLQNCSHLIYIYMCFRKGHERMSKSYKSDACFGLKLGSTRCQPVRKSEGVGRKFQGYHLGGLKQQGVIST